MNEKLDEIDNESKANAGHVDNLREVNKELLERIKVNVQDDIDKQTGTVAGHALGIWICGCSLFYKRELWVSKSAGAHSTKSLKISGCKR